MGICKCGYNFRLQHSNSSEPSRQSGSPSQIQSRGKHCSPLWHLNWLLVQKLTAQFKLKYEQPNRQIQYKGNTYCIDSAPHRSRRHSRSHDRSAICWVCSCHYCSGTVLRRKWILFDKKRRWEKKYIYWKSLLSIWNSILHSLRVLIIYEKWGKKAGTTRVVHLTIPCKRF